MYRIALQRDKIRHENGELQSFSDRWIELATQNGIEVRIVNAFARDVLDQLVGCDGFMWRFDYSATPRLFAKRLLPAIEHGLDIPVFPSWKTVWHFEDKIAQHYLLQAAGISTPETSVFWKAESALEFCRKATYPLVMKLAYGYQSANVRLLRNSDEAAYWVKQMFGPGRNSITPARSRWRGSLRKAAHRPAAAARLMMGKSLYSNLQQSELQHGYFYVQEFLPDNAFDTRVTIIGSRAFAFRRFNRPSDFRASGSGNIDWNPADVDLETVRIAFRIARRLQTQSVAVDGLRRGEERVINEISYTYASWAVRDCPGHWELNGEPEAGELIWVEGQMRPEDAIMEDFVALIKREHK